MTTVAGITEAQAKDKLYIRPVARVFEVGSTNGIGTLESSGLFSTLVGAPPPTPQRPTPSRTAALLEIVSGKNITPVIVLADRMWQEGQVAGFCRRYMEYFQAPKVRVVFPVSFAHLIVVSRGVTLETHGLGGVFAFTSEYDVNHDEGEQTYVALLLKSETP